MEKRTMDQDAFVFPLSFAQERLWFLHQLEPDSPLYNVPAVTCRISGPLQITVLERSLAEIVQRHESLRTTFGQVDGQPVQVIHPFIPFTIQIFDLGHLAPEQREAEALRIAGEEVRRLFDLARGPLFRAVLLRLAAEEHILVLPIHHIIFDGWSIGILLHELETLYTAFVSGEPSPLPEPPIQYADYAQWQREWLQGEVLEEQLAYWRQQLAGAPPLLQLPADRPRPKMQTHAGRRQPFTIPAELVQSLGVLGRQEGATLFMTLLAAFQTWLYRYSGQEDIIVGTPVAGRTQPETQNIIGFFVNTLALRGDLSGEPTFRELLRRVRGVALSAYAHQELPFEKLVAELSPERSLSHSPLLQVMFILQNAPLTHPHLPGLTVTPVEVDTGTTKFDLTLSLFASDWTTDDLSGWFAYNTDLFDATTIQRMAGHFAILLQAIASDPDQSIATLPLLTEAERWQMLVAWNDTAADFPAHKGIHHLFEEQAERTPEAIAVTLEGQQLTYRELNRRANQLAHTLQTLGVGPETLVGLCVERSPEMIIGLLGVLKAGGAYVPLDPGYPRERLAFMLQDTQAPVLLTQQSLLERLPPCGAKVVRLDADWPVIARHSPENPHSAVGPENLAYVIYTSGSTGQPKGVLLQHQGLCNLISAQIEAFQISKRSRVLQFASFGFDASVSEIFTALCSGATLVLARQEVLASPPDLAHVLQDERITVVTLPPSMLRLLPETELPELRTLVSAGEACSWDIVARWAPGRRFLNAYGPTEATIGPICDVVAKPAGDPAAPVPIGRPIANMQAYVLDGHDQPVPIGVTGELYLGGVGLARGYLNRPDLTAQKFVQNPFGRYAKQQSSKATDGMRLYKTGDLARYRPDGRLEFMGRLDHQVKVRGFRIELGEIETTLVQHPAVRQAVVLAREDTPGEQRLVAYVVPAQDGRRGGSETRPLRTFLQGRLPGYMVPNTFVFLEALPLTPSGKVERKALPAPDSRGGSETRPYETRPYVPQRNPLEQALARMWQEILSLDLVGIHDNFFELGGDSIRGAIFINRLQKILGQPVYVVALFEAPTIASLASYLSRHYPDAVLGIWGAEALGEAMASDWSGDQPGTAVGEKVDAARIAHIRQLIPPLPPMLSQNGSGPKNPPAIFVLSPPRSGSTLLRAMLGGHPLLFAPPELELLSFNTLAERKKALQGRYSFWLEGTIRALMEIKGCTADEARQIMETYEQQLTTKEFYGLLQQWIAPCLLVDKTPAYALDLEILKRMEADFDRPRYIHLLRHPCGMIHSFVEARLEQVFFRYDHPFSRRELAELIWLVCQQNILAFLREVPAERQHVVVFEELVRKPQAVMQALCDFLGLDYHPAMIRPYEGQRMTDGIHPLSKMLGDVRFHEHRGIDPSAADRWKEHFTVDFLGDVTWQLAETLGYERPSPSPARVETLIEQADEDTLAQLLAELEGLSDDEAHRLLTEELHR